MQLSLEFDTGPWSGYGWITVRGGRVVLALAYHTWDRWFALPKDNPKLKREIHGTITQVEAWGERVEELTNR